MESEAGHWDALQGTWNSDALFGFAVRAILDHQARPSRLGEDRVWRCLLEMGLKGGEMPGELRETWARCRLSAMQQSNELMCRQEGSSCSPVFIIIGATTPLTFLIVRG